MVTHEDSSGSLRDNHYAGSPQHGILSFNMKPSYWIIPDSSLHRFCPYPVNPVIYQSCNVSPRKSGHSEVPSGFSDAFVTNTGLAFSRSPRRRTARISFAPWASWVASCSPRATCRQPHQRTDAPNLPVNDPQTLILFDCKF